MKARSSAETAGGIEPAPDACSRESIAGNLELIRKRIAEAEADTRSRWGERDIRIVAAAKNVPLPLIEYAVGECGLREAGENRVQELCAKYPVPGEESSASKNLPALHFIGTLQSNKVRQIINRVCMIQSLDRMSLAKEIGRRAEQHSLVMPCLIELNVGCEPNKGGVLPGDAEDFAEAVHGMPGIALAGVMTMAPLVKGEEYREYFTRAREIFESLMGYYRPEEPPVLSMGMSGSYAVAVECGATMVRPGSAIFGARQIRQI